MSDEKKSKSGRTILIDSKENFGRQGVLDFFLEQEKQREKMLEFISKPNLNCLQPFVESSRIYEELVKTASLSVSHMNDQFTRQIAQIDFSGLYKTHFDPSIFTRAAEDIFLTNSNQMAELLAQATRPPPGLDLFADTLSKFNFDSVIGMKFSTASHFANEDSVLQSTFEQFKGIAELEWTSILKASAALTYETAISGISLPKPAEETSSPHAVVEPKLISFDEARESIFAQVGTTSDDLPHNMQVAYRFLWNLEREMRRFIQNVMIVCVGPQWERSNLPGKMFESWNEKYQKSLKYGRNPNTALIEYSDFTDYLPLITNKKNWPFFKDFFGNTEFVHASFKRLFPYRLDTMHGRDIPEDEILILAGDCQWLLKKLGLAEISN